MATPAARSSVEPMNASSSWSLAGSSPNRFLLATTSAWRRRKDPLARGQDVVRVVKLLRVGEEVEDGPVLLLPVGRCERYRPEGVLRATRLNRAVVQRAIAGDHRRDGRRIVRWREPQQVEREEI